LGITIHKHFDDQLIASLRCEIEDGDLLLMPPTLDTGWRQFPWIVVAQALDGDMLLERAGRDSICVRAGQAVVVPPNLPHRFANRAGCVNRNRWCHLNFFVFNRINVAIVFDLSQLFVGQKANRVGEIALEMGQMPTTGKVNWEWKQQVQHHWLGAEMAALVLEEAHLKANWREVERLISVLEYIEGNLDAPLERKDLAKKSHLSVSRFAVLFRTVMGVSPADYVREVKLRRGQSLLLSTSLTVVEIAKQCGFKSEFHFSRLFKTRFGSSPTFYRAQRKPGL
jgi:AraC-like DNA-binding protein